MTALDKKWIRQLQLFLLLPNTSTRIHLLNLQKKDKEKKKNTVAAFLLMRLSSCDVVQVSSVAGRW